jgi:large subunit ribosomal protein L33
VLRQPACQYCSSSDPPKSCPILPIRVPFCAKNRFVRRPWHPHLPPAILPGSEIWSFFYTSRTTMAKKSGGKRKKKVETVFLVCDETGDYNYTIRRKGGGEKLKLSKFSPRLRKHTLHTEKKK